MYFQLYISSKDAGRPTVRESSNRAHVTVDVVRNQHDPIFFEDSYAATIRKDLPNGASVITVAAQDADTAVCLVCTIEMWYFVCDNFVTHFCTLSKLYKHFHSPC